MSNIWTFDEDFKLIKAINNAYPLYPNIMGKLGHTRAKLFLIINNRNCTSIQNRMNLYIMYGQSRNLETNQDIKRFIEIFRGNYYSKNHGHDIDSPSINIANNIETMNKEKEFVWPTYAEITRQDGSIFMKSHSIITGSSFRKLLVPFLSDYDTVTLKHKQFSVYDIIKVVELLPGKEIFLIKEKYDIIDEHDNVLTTVESSEKLKIIKHV